MEIVASDGDTADTGSRKIMIVTSMLMVVFNGNNGWSW